MGRDLIEQLTCLVFFGHLPRHALFVINTSPQALTNIRTFDGFVRASKSYCVRLYT